MRSNAESFIDRRSAYERQRPLGEQRPDFAKPDQPMEDGCAPRPGCAALLGDSGGLHHVIDEIEMVAPTDATVLIRGETGVGKELVARTIHQRSLRNYHPMVTVNCTAIPHELFESGFFGHVRGAFSGAWRDRTGRFQLADGGTIFLDEVGDLPVEMQPKLLRILQEAEFEPVGDCGTRHVDVRVIAASNRDLGEAVRVGRLRRDLYYRLSVFPIEVPPLRHRKDDIAILAIAFLAAACDRLHRPVPILTDLQLWQLRDYEWPGNVRELRNVVDRAAIKARVGALEFDVHGHSDLTPRAESGGPDTVPCEAVVIIKADEMKRRERDNIMAALQRSKGRIYGTSGAAELLGIRPTTLTARIKRLGLKQMLEV